MTIQSEEDNSPPRDSSGDNEQPNDSNSPSDKITKRNGNDHTPEVVWKQFEDHWKLSDKAQSGLQPHRSAWTQFAEWMEEQGYDYLTELTQYFPTRHDDWILTHETYNKGRLSRSFHLTRIQNVVRHAKSRGWIDPEVVPDKESWQEAKPDIGEKEKTRSDPLTPERGERIMRWVSKNRPYSRAHVLWILLFKYGFRNSAIRSLDRGALIVHEPDDWPASREFHPHLRLEDRPDLGDDDDRGLPLKNTNSRLAGRRVPLKREDADTLYRYIQGGSPTGAVDSRKEFEEPDKYGLKGLITGEHSPRISREQIGSRTHWLTCPTTYAEECGCDGCRSYREAHNGKNPPPHQVRKYCKVSRSPHQVRHGAITRMVDDHEHSEVAQIVGTSAETIKKVYDRADEYRRMERVASTWCE
jgi:hypothetical protein